MSESFSKILPDFPDGETFKELRFHLKELHADLLGLIRDTEVLSTPTNPPDSSQIISKIRYGMEPIISQIEHDLSSHLTETLKLLEKVVQNPLMSNIRKRLNLLQIKWKHQRNPRSENEQNDNYPALITGLRHLALELRLALEKVEQAAWSQKGVSQQLEKLEQQIEEIAEVLADRVWSYALDLYLQAYRLHREVDKVEAAQEDYWQLLTTPLREENHPLAHRLSSCPRCGAMLTSNDRTFDGCYCESCRTHWMYLPKTYLLIQELAIEIVIPSQTNTPFNLEFLLKKSIVPADWELSISPIYTTQKYQSFFTNGIKIVAKNGTITLIESLQNKSIEQIKILSVARKYFEVIPHTDYQTVSINIKSFLTFEDEGSDVARKYITHLLAPRSRLDFGSELVKSAINLSYTLERGIFNLAIEETQLQLADKLFMSAVLFSGSFIYEFNRNHQAQNRDNLLQLIDNWKIDLETYQEIIHLLTNEGR